MLLSHECYCMNPTPYSRLFTLLLCLAEQLKPDLSSAALLPCKTWLRFHFETESDSCCPASSNVSSSADTKEVHQDKHFRNSKAFYFYICTCMISATGLDGVLLSQFDICTWLNLFYILILYYSTTFWIQLFTQLHFLYVTDIVKMLYPNMQYFLISL